MAAGQRGAGKLGVDGTAAGGRERYATACLVAANLVPIAGILLFGWQASDVVALYWAENLIAGFYTVLRMASAEAPAAARLFLIPFFVFHFGLFCGVHGAFVVAFFKVNVQYGDPLNGTFRLLMALAREPGMPWTLAALYVSHGVSFVENHFVRGERHAALSSLMFRPYERMIGLHIAIVFGGFAIVALGSPTPLVLALVGLKIGIDVAAHRRALRRAQTQGAAPASPAPPPFTVTPGLVLSTVAALAVLGGFIAAATTARLQPPPPKRVAAPAPETAAAGQYHDPGPPVVEELEPASPLPGGTVTLRGTNFGTRENRDVLIRGAGIEIATEVLAWSQDAVTLRIPADPRLQPRQRYMLRGLTRNPVRDHNWVAFGISDGKDAKLAARVRRLWMERLEPGSGRPPVATVARVPRLVDKGGALELHGEHFGAAANHTVYLVAQDDWETPLPAAQWSDKTVVLQVPDDPAISTGPHRLLITRRSPRAYSYSPWFHVGALDPDSEWGGPGAARIDWVDPGQAVPGETVTLRGRNFGTADNHVVYLAGYGIEIALQPLSWADDHASVRIPPDLALPEEKRYYYFVIKTREPLALSYKESIALAAPPAKR